MTGPLALLLLLAGMLSSAINVVAGGGSLITLACLLALGQSAVSANATVRLGILVQSFLGLWSFRRQGQQFESGSRDYLISLALGALIGSWLSLHMGEFAYRKVAAVVIFVSGVAILADARGLQTNSAWGKRLWMLVAGIYGGFLQAGVGFCLILACRSVGMDLKESNHFKMLATLVISVPAIGVFAGLAGMQWDSAILLALGTVAGVPLGVWATVGLPEKTLKKVIIFFALSVAIWLWLKT